MSADKSSLKELGTTLLGTTGMSLGIRAGMATLAFAGPAGMVVGAVVGGAIGWAIGASIPDMVKKDIEETGGKNVKNALDLATILVQAKQQEREKDE